MTLEEHTLKSGMTLKLAKPRTEERRPAALVLHERYGIVKHTEDIVERLSQDGFVACVPDLFHRFDGDREALARGDARADMRDDEALEDLDEVMAFLREQSYVDGSEIGILGFCQSGRQPLLYAGRRTDVAAIVVAFGGVGKGEWAPRDGQPNSVSDFIHDLSCPVLGLFGEKDHVVAVEEAMRFRNELEDARKSYRIRVYRDAPHGWINDTMPGRYRPKTTAESWAELTGFLRETMGPGREKLGSGWDPNHVTWSFESDISPDYDFANNRRLE